MFAIRWFIACLAILWVPCSLLHAQGEYGFVNTRPSGQPYLSPEESVRRMRVSPGWEVKVFAAEPDIVTPISCTVDEKARLWVVECYEYPKRTPPGRKARDRIKVLEDTAGAGKADKVTVWAEGKDLPHFDMASGIEVGRGGVFLGAAPYLFFLQDTKGSGHCDKVDILLRGFGSQDTHEVLSTLQWGPDGLLYGLHGIFTQSRLAEVKMNAAVWRYSYPARKFDIFAEGTSNPWGLDFDAHGQAFLAACVIPHFFHMIPGGTYIRQAGSSKNPYAYGLLREISDHTHHQESGWAHAGVLVMQGDDIPAEYKNSVLMGSIHGCSIKRDILERRGSTFVAHHGSDFLVSGDKNFRPINLRWGPDGSIYVIDWHDQNPCHQAAPDSWDMTHGRIYKIQRQGAKPWPAADLTRKSNRELVELLKNNNPWWHRTALRLLAERHDPCVPLMIWLAYEPAVAAGGQSSLDWLREQLPANLLVRDDIVPRALRRLTATRKQEDLAACIRFLGQAQDPVVRRNALTGMLRALENLQADRPANWAEVSAELMRDADAEVTRLARRLAVKLNDVQALRRSLALALAKEQPVGERIDAVRDVAAVHPPEALRPLLDLLAREEDPSLRAEACRALTAYDRPEIAATVLKGWKQYPAAVRVEAVNLLAGRVEWAAALLAAVGRQEVPRTDLNDNTILRIRALRNKYLDGQIEKVWGRVRDQTPAELNQLIEQMRTALDQ